MTVRFYMDEHVPSPITNGLRDRGVDVLTVQEDFREGDDDGLLLDRAAELGRVVFTYDSDFYWHAAKRQAAGIEFTGIIIVGVSKLSNRQCIDDLEMIAKCCELDEWVGKISRLPLTN